MRKKFSNLTFLSLAFVLPLVMLPQTSFAYLQLADWGAATDISYIRWLDEDIPVTYYVDPGGSGVQGLDGVALVRRSFDAWNNITTSTMRTVYGGAAPEYTGDGNITVEDIDYGSDEFPRPEGVGNFRNDGRVEVIYDDTGEWFDRSFGEDSGILGLDQFVVKVETGEILDSDIMINVPSITDSESDLDLEAVLVHEIGHLLGMAHTPIFSSVPNSKIPTMFAYAGFEDNPVNMRSLEPDDTAGLSFIYPIGDFKKSTAAIRGTVTRADGLPGFGTHVVALDETTGISIGTIAGYYISTQTGRYELSGLPPGNYKIFIEAIDGSEAVGYTSGFNISSILSTTYGFSFPKEYFNNTQSQSSGQRFALEGGEILKGIDFVQGSENGGAPLETNIRTGFVGEGGGGGGCTISHSTGSSGPLFGSLAALLCSVFLFRFRRRCL